jgi:hypothetical protein
MMLIAASWILTGLFCRSTAMEDGSALQLTGFSFTSRGLHGEYRGDEQHLRAGSQVQHICSKFHQRGRPRCQRTEGQGWLLWSARAEKQPDGMGLRQWSIRPAFSRYSRARVQTLRTSYTPASISRATSSSPACCKCATPVDAVCMTFADRVAGSAPWL